MKSDRQKNEEFLSLKKLTPGQHKSLESRLKQLEKKPRSLFSLKKKINIPWKERVSNMVVGRPAMKLKRFDSRVQQAYKFMV